MNTTLKSYRNYQYTIENDKQPVLHLIQNETMKSVHQDPRDQTIYTNVSFTTRLDFDISNRAEWSNQRRKTMDVDFMSYETGYMYTVSFFSSTTTVPVIWGPMNFVSLPYIDKLYDLYFESDTQRVHQGFDTRKPCHFYIRANDPNINDFYKQMGRDGVVDIHGIFSNGSREGYYYFLCLEVYEPVASWLLVYSESPAHFAIKSQK